MENFISSMGYEPILSEKGSIAYVYDQPLDESCYREVGTADVFVLIIGGRYGGEVSSARGEDEIKTFFDRYESITSKEHKHAADRGIPVYILIESAVYSEYQTFQVNKANTGINYAHVDSVNVFYFIEAILGQERNNPMFLFSKYAEIEFWLKEQWSGLFRELINRRSQQQQIETLNARISDLSELTTTLKTYSEAILTTVNKKPETEDLIKRETERIEQKSILSKLGGIGYFNHLRGAHRLKLVDILKAVEESNDWDDLRERLMKLEPTSTDDAESVSKLTCLSSKGARRDINILRSLLTKPEFDEPIETKLGGTKRPVRPSMQSAKRAEDSQE